MTNHPGIAGADIAIVAIASTAAPRSKIAIHRRRRTELNRIVSDSSPMAGRMQIPPAIW
jgi:hypothetical protein